MNEKRVVPLTSDELREIADSLDEIVRVVPVDESGCIPDGGWAWGLSVTISDDVGNVLGHVKPHGDGWLGFYPAEVTG